MIFRIKQLLWLRRFHARWVFWKISESQRCVTLLYTFNQFSFFRRVNFDNNLWLQFSSQVTKKPSHWIFAPTMFDAVASRVTCVHPSCLIVSVPAYARNSLPIMFKNIDSALSFCIFKLSTKQTNKIILVGLLNLSLKQCK